MIVKSQRKVGKGLHTLATITVLCLINVACGVSETDSLTVSENPDGSTGIGINIPQSFLSTRVLNLDTIQLEVMLDSQIVDSTRSGNQWTANFTLLDDNNHSVQVSWSENVNDRNLMLAVSQPLTISRTSNRNISINQYTHRQFDEDVDAISNLDERILGRDPLSQDFVTIAENQTDCRALVGSLQFPNFYVSIANPNFSNALAVTTSGTIPNISSAVTEGDLAKFESFWVLQPGALTISHQNGGPVSTGAVLFDTDLNGELRFLAQDLAIDNGQSIDRRAVVSATVQPGLYCYRLESTRVDDPMADTRLSYTFLSNP